MPPVRLLLMVGGPLASLIQCQEVGQWTSDLEQTVAEVVAPSRDEPAFYSYTNKAGRTVYVNHRTMVPDSASAKRVDLTHVSLNKDLGADWADRVDRDYEALTESAFCQDRVEEAERSSAAILWHRHGHLAGIGGLIAVLLFTAPWVARRVGFGPWFRALAMLLPMLGALLALTHFVKRGADTLAQVRRTADLCSAEEPAGGDVQSRIQRAAALHELQLKKAEAEARGHLISR